MIAIVFKAVSFADIVHQPPPYPNIREATDGTEPAFDPGL